MKLQGISFLRIFPNIVSAAGSAAAALDTSSDMVFERWKIKDVEN